MTKKKIIIGIVAIWLIGSVIFAVGYAVKHTAENTDGSVVSLTDPEAEPAADTSEVDDLQALKDSLKDKYDIGEPLPVNDDVTGNWRMVTIYSSATPEEYAADYFKAYFETEESTEVHTIINLGLKTTTSIRRLAGNILDITVHEYVDGEETSAKTLGKGMILQEYSLNTETGETEDLLEE